MRKKVIENYDCINFIRDDEDYRLTFWECSNCSKWVIKLDDVDTSEVGTPYGRTHYKSLGFITGGRKENLVLCEACLGLSKKLKEIKDLDKKKKDILKVLNDMSESMSRVQDDIKIEKAKLDGKMEDLR